MKCLRVLQYFPPPEDPVVLRMLNEVLKRVITGSEVAKNINKNNAQHAIVFEAIALALALEADADLLTAGVLPDLALLLAWVRHGCGSPLSSPDNTTQRTLSIPVFARPSRWHSR